MVKKYNTLYIGGGDEEKIIGRFKIRVYYGKENLITEILYFT